MADLELPYQHKTVGKFLRAFIAGIHLWMTDDKKTKEILAKRLKIKDKKSSMKPTWRTKS